MGCPLKTQFTIIIADDYDALRDTLKTALEAHDGWRVVGVASNGRDAVQKVIALNPDAAILDFAMPAMDGIAAAREIRSALPLLPILLYTNHVSATLEMEAGKAGIKQVVAKNQPIDQLLNAVEAIANEQSAALG
jgi:DNA-binding NarL/FixJ family response regulator